MHGGAGNGWHVPVPGQGGFIDLSTHMVNGGGAMLSVLAPEEAAEKPHLDPHVPAADEPAPALGAAHSDPPHTPHTFAAASNA